LGLAAALVVWGVIAAVHPVFHVPEEFHIGMNAPLEDRLANLRAQNRVMRQHALLYLGGLGLLLGTVLGAREAMLRRDWLLPLIAGVLGLLGGLLGGFLGCLIYEYVHADGAQAELKHTLAAQWLLAAPLGLGIGLGLGLATRTANGILKATLGGIAAATLAAVLYPVLVSLLLPEASTDALLPEERVSRVLLLGLLSGLIGAVIPLATRQRSQARIAAQDMTARGA
jgi:hypothetical protein